MRAPEGQLVFRMGWVGKWTSRTFGQVTGDELPAMADSAEVLIRLAAKYDADC